MPDQHPADLAVRAASSALVGAIASDRAGDYALLRRIGAGTYGDVWLARDVVGKLVAVKLIDRERLSLLSRTNREERALGLLRAKLPEHPNLIRVHHVGNDDARLY